MVREAKVKDNEKQPTGLIAREASPFAVIAAPDGKEILQQTLIDGGVGLFSLTQIRVPSGTTPAWTVETLDGPQVTQSLEVILAATRSGLKKWWRAKLGDGPSGPPDCYSVDSITGYGVNSLSPDSKPGEHDCHTCAWNEFKSARSGGVGKDCSDYMAALVFRAGCYLPDALFIPASSLKSMQRYQVKLGQAGKSYWKVVTRLDLEKKSGATFDFCAVQPRYVRELSPEEISVLSDARDVLDAYLIRHFAAPGTSETLG